MENSLVDRSVNCGLNSERGKLLDLLKSLHTSDLQTLLFTASRVELLYWVTSKSSDEIPLDKACSLVKLLLAQEDQPTIDVTIYKVILNWLKIYIQSRSSTLCILSTLKVLLTTNPDFIPLVVESLFNSHTPVLLIYMEYLGQSSQKNAEYYSECIIMVEIFDRCMCNLLGSLSTEGNVCVLRNKIVESIADFVLQLLFAESCELRKSSNFIQFSISSIAVLSKVGSVCIDFVKTRVGKLLGVIKAYMCFGLNDFSKNELSFNPSMLQVSHQSLYDYTDVTVDSERQHIGGKISKTRKLRSMTRNTKIEHKLNGADQLLDANNEVDIHVSESDSENEGNHQSLSLSKLRLAALSLLNNLIKILSRNVLYGYWHAFFPDAERNTDGILFIATHDPNTRCRVAALQVTTHLIQRAKQFLEQAEICDSKQSSFLPFSIYLGQTILNIYGALSYAIDSEPSISVLIQTLKCLAVLVQSTPFHRMSGKFVLQFAKQMQDLVQHKDISIQVSALTVMEFLVSTPKLTREISEAVGIYVTHCDKNYVNSNRHSDSIDSCEINCFEEFVDSDEDGNVIIHENTDSMQTYKKSAETDVSWLLNVVLQNLIVDEKLEVKLSAALKIESLQVLSAMSNHFSNMICKLDVIAEALHQSLLDSLPEVRLYAARCLDCLGYKMNEFLLVALSPNEKIVNCQKFWTDMLPIVISKISEKNQTNAFKVSLCDYLSNIGVNVFNNLPYVSKMNLLSFLSGVGSDVDENTIVRVAALRALAVYILFPSLKENLVFIENTAELTILLAYDSNLLVRIKALWSIGNISDALIKNSEAVYTERISNDLLIRLIKVATDSCCDNDKVRCNAVRALGNLLRLLTKDILDNINFRHLFQSSIGKLVECINASGNAKVKWNSCYAIACLIRNNAIFEATSTYDDFIWLNQIFPSLSHLIIQHSNFKVRINAVYAIINVQKKSYFGEYFFLCWRTLLTAVEKSYNLDNFLEYNHRDCLQERLCVAISHLTQLAHDDDFVILKKEFLNKVEFVTETWFRVVNRMAPENAAPLLSCPVLLKERINSNQKLSTENRTAILLIANTFSPPKQHQY